MAQEADLARRGLCAVRKGLAALETEEGDPKEESTQEGGGRQREKRWSVAWREREWRARGRVKTHWIQEKEST